MYRNATLVRPLSESNLYNYTSQITRTPMLHSIPYQYYPLPRGPSSRSTHKPFPPNFRDLLLRFLHSQLPLKPRPLLRRNRPFPLRAFDDLHYFLVCILAGLFFPSKSTLLHFSRKPFVAGGVLLLWRRVGDHATIHAAAFSATSPGCGNGTVAGAFCEFCSLRSQSENQEVASWGAYF